jgi:hypothetical protein
MKRHWLAWLQCQEMKQRMSNSEPSPNNLEIRLTSSDLLRSFGHLEDCLDNPANIFNSGTVKIFSIRFVSVNISRNSSQRQNFRISSKYYNCFEKEQTAFKCWNGTEQWHRRKCWNYKSARHFAIPTRWLWLSLSSDTLFSLPIFLRISIDSSSKLAMTSSGRNCKMSCWLVVSTFSSVSLLNYKSARHFAIPTRWSHCEFRWWIYWYSQKNRKGEKRIRRQR